VDPPVNLTRRGQEVAELVSLGLSNRQIAERLFLSERTIEWHVEQILNRLGFTSRSEVAAWIGRTQAATPLHAAGVKHRSNLPSPLTSFVGRESALSSVKELVAANRLVTVVGSGGNGKTRMAIRLAHELEPDYPDGAWLCELAPLADQALVSDAIAHAMSLIVPPAVDPMTAVREHLIERTALLVLDNCEHLAEAPSEVAVHLLAACPGLRILATSRAPLNVAGEAVWRLEPLPEEDAIRLFVQRAAAAVPGFRLTESNAGQVAIICRRLDCIPLAIELVAPRLRVLSVDELAEAALDRGGPVRSGRHGSLDVVADWSYRLLDPHEQSLFRRLGVFAGWFEADDAAALAPEAADTAALLAGLTEKSMLVAGRSDDGVARYRLLEILKIFGRARMTDVGELDATRLSHAERMVSLAERASLTAADPDRRIRLKLAAMVDDVRAAMGTLLELSPRRAAWLAGTLSPAGLTDRPLQEMLRWTTSALEANPLPSVERCWVLHAHAAQLVSLGRLAEAASYLKEATTLAALPECDAIRGDLLIVAGLVHGGLGNYAAAAAEQREAIGQFRREGNSLKATRYVNHLAMTLLYQGQLKEARVLAQESLDDLRRNRSSRLHPVLDTLAQTNALLGDLDLARDAWLEAIPLALQYGELLMAAQILHGLAYAAGLRGKTETALRVYACALRIHTERDEHPYEPLTPHVTELAERLINAVGPDLAERLRSEGEAMTISEAMRLAESEG
jgi:predicted ATPase/DNA-binding CsgD family transcriptional regulator